MKKSICKNLSLSIVCLLGIAGLTSISPYLNKGMIPLKADGTTVDLSTLTADYVAQDGDTLTGTLGGRYKISAADGATVTLDNATIVPAGEGTHDGTGLTCEGDVTLILSGVNNINSFASRDYPAIFIAENKTLTIEGEGTLNANAPSQCAAAIGTGSIVGVNRGGNIVINSGTINANKDGSPHSHGAGIGSSRYLGGDYENVIGDITINGGTVRVKGGNNSAGIGSSYSASNDNTCGDITINGGTVVVEAGTTDGAAIGSGRSYHGHKSICGDITIRGGDIEAIGHKSAAVIGSGNASSSTSSCGDIRIYSTVTRLYAYFDEYAEAPRGDTIGAGDNGATCGKIYFDDVESSPITDDPFVYPPEHDHNWSYFASGSSITASCSNEECPVTTGLTLTLVAPTDLTYDGTAKEASFETGYDTTVFSSPTIAYYKNDVSVTNCVDVGTYEARVTVGGATASLEFTIAQADPTGYDIPTGLSADYGKKLSTIALPNNWSWKNPNDLVGNVGERTHIAIYTPADPNYKAAEVNLVVTVNQAIPIDYDIPEDLEASYGDTLSSVELPSEWAWKNPTDLVGNVGEQTHIAIYTPADPNYKSIEEELIVTVNQAIPTGYDIPTGLNATYGDTLSSVTLPANWSWKTPTDKVGNAGNREHIAIYTPADTNYKAIEANVTITVAKATPVPPTVPTIDASCGVTLSTIALPEGFSWMDGTQKTSTVGEHVFKAKYNPDAANYNDATNIDITLNVKWTLVDPTEGDVSVSFNDGDTEYDANISVRVEIKTEISTEQKRTNYAELGKKYISKNEDIGAIFSVKLIKTVNGVESEIQPSDIKEGTKITISMTLPTELVGISFRLLHIHDVKDVEEINNSKYAVSGDGKTVTLETEKLSEFAFIIASNGNNGFIYTNGLPGWAIALIIIGSLLFLLILAYFLLLFVFNKWIRKEDKALRAFKLFGIEKDDKYLLLVFPFKFDYRVEEEIFDTKDEALDNK